MSDTSDYPSASGEPRWDPTYLHASREAVVIFFVWLLALAWTVPYCYLFGYRSPTGESTELVWGMPSWVFFGIVCPWLAANVVTIVFCLGYFRLDPLEEGEAEEAGGDGSDSAAETSGGRTT